jgi:hypothetical protein
VHEVVAPVGQRLDDRRHARHPDLQPRVERDVDLGHGAEAAVGDRVGAHDLDLESRHAVVADLGQRVRDAVHAADPVGDERDVGADERRVLVVRAQHTDVTDAGTRETQHRGPPRGTVEQ